MCAEDGIKCISIRRWHPATSPQYALQEIAVVSPDLALDHLALRVDDVAFENLGLRGPFRHLVKAWS